MHLDTNASYYGENRYFIYGCFESKGLFDILHKFNNLENKINRLLRIVKGEEEYPERKFSETIEKIKKNILNYLTNCAICDSNKLLTKVDPNATFDPLPQAYLILCHFVKYGYLRFGTEKFKHLITHQKNKNLVLLLIVSFNNL